jgi:hypothetical protein
MHPSGHQSVFETADGGVVLAGQVIYSKAEYEHLQAANTVFEDEPPARPRAVPRVSSTAHASATKSCPLQSRTAVWEP